MAGGGIPVFWRGALFEEIIAAERMREAKRDLGAGADGDGDAGADGVVVAPVFRLR